jgi:predicted phage terminase large subunit-like protein
VEKSGDGGINLNFHLHAAQMEVFTCKARFIALAAGRRFGKSDLAVKRAITSALDPANVKKKPVWIVAPVQPQAKVIYWQVLLNMTAGIRVSAHINDGAIELFNGVQIAIKGADRPDTLRGVGLWDLILDEYASMKPVTWDEILAPALSDVLGRALFIGTPAGRNHFYKICASAKSELDPEWAYFHFTSYDNPYLPEGEVEAAKKRLSTHAFQQEYMASFESGSSGIFLRDWVKYNPVEPPVGDWFVAADLAGFTDGAAVGRSKVRHLDFTAIPQVKITPEGRWWVKNIQIGRWGVEETANRIVSAISDVRATKVGIEKGALYNAVSPYLMSAAARKKMPLIVTPLSHANESKNNRIVWALQGKFEHGQVELCPGEWNEEFTDQLVNFPSSMVHDDGPDSMAMIDQLAGSDVFSDFGLDVSEPYWKPIDASSGY